MTLKRHQSSEGVGLDIPERGADCSGGRPSWYPWQIQVDACDDDAPDPEPFTGRQLRVPAAPDPPDWIY